MTFRYPTTQQARDWLKQTEGRPSKDVADFMKLPENYKTIEYYGDLTFGQQLFLYQELYEEDKLVEESGRKIRQEIIPLEIHH